MANSPFLNSTNLKAFDLNKVPFINIYKLLEYLEANTEQHRSDHHTNPKDNILWIFDRSMCNIRIWKWFDISWIFVPSYDVCPYDSNS